MAIAFSSEHHSKGYEWAADCTYVILYIQYPVCFAWTSIYVPAVFHPFPCLSRGKAAENPTSPWALAPTWKMNNTHSRSWFDSTPAKPLIRPFRMPRCFLFRLLWCLWQSKCMSLAINVHRILQCPPCHFPLLYIGWPKQRGWVAHPRPYS